MFPDTLFWVANAVLCFVLLAALRRASFTRLWNNEFLHVFLGACVVLLLLWNTRAGVLPALNFHLLGVTAVTLMFGWAYAVFAVVLVTAGSIIAEGSQWGVLGLNALVTGCVPVLVTQSILRFARQRLPYNFFVYVYVNGFLAAGLSILAACLLGALIMLGVDAASGEWLGYQYLPYMPLIFFAEAVVNGMIMTAMVALRPGWVASFDDNLYIKNK